MKVHLIYGLFLLTFLGLALDNPHGVTAPCLAVEQRIIPPQADSVPPAERIIFYNVENLFHPSNDSLKTDDDFTPAGAYHWTYSRYMEKIQKLGKLFIAMGEGRFPVIIGLCEVENRQVLNDLLSRSVLKYSPYHIIHKDSPDSRGIDVALLYDPSRFFPMGLNFINVSDHILPGFATRDILHVTGLLYGSVLCHVFVNHWPSRRGGKLESQDKRLAVATVLRAFLERIFTEDPVSNVIIMGDFNDEPEDRSIKHVLGAGNPEAPEEAAFIYNLMYSMSRKGKGTHFRINNFAEAAVLDQVMVSKSILTGENGMKLVGDKAEIYVNPSLQGKKNEMPLRTYQGLKYLGGFSDHLPVFIEIQIIDSL